MGPGDGASPLHMAVLTNNKEIVGLLMDNGAEIDIKAKDIDAGTPLHWAVYLENREMAELLKTKPATGRLISHQKVLFDPNGLITKTLISLSQP